MTPGEYRREYAAYCAALARARYDYHMGRTAAVQRAPLRDRYADLWTQAAVADLARAWQETPAQFETERTALCALTAVARLGFTAVQVEAVEAELARCTAAAQVEWGGTRLNVADVPAQLAVEADATRRRELAARWFAALRGCDDLRAAHHEALRAAAATLGFDSYFDLLADAARADPNQLAAAADTLLARTHAAYTVRLSEWTARTLPPPQARAPVYADSLFCARLPQFDALFPAASLRATYTAAMGNLGIHVERQTNLRVEWGATAGGATGAACFGVDPPADVRLVGGADGGAAAYRELCAAAGGAQQLAWVSRATAARYPEFVYAPAETVRAGYGFLFGSLLHDPAWLSAQRGLTPEQARACARAYARGALHDARRDAAWLQHQLALRSAPDVRAESLGADFVAGHTEATGFRYDAALHLWADTVRPAAGLSHLRARLFAAALSEYLRTRHGRRWWASPRAGDELIDLWNTGARYTVEELAALVGAGALDVELLADTLLTAAAVGERG